MPVNPLLNRRRFLAISGSAALAGALAACGTSAPSGTSSTSTGSAGPAGDGEKFGTADKPVTVSFWTWGTPDPALVPAYKKLHPYVDLQVTAVGSTADLYPKLATVYKAGTGAPDCTALELPMMPTYAAAGYLEDMTPYGASVDAYDASAARASQFGGKLYAVPTDYGPMVMYYRTDVFDKFGLTVPTTWDEYRQTAEALKKAAPDAFISNLDPGDSTEALGLIWQAGGRPFQLDGTNLAVDLADEGTTKYATYWSGMLRDGLVNPVPGFTADWFNQMGSGTYATWFAGAWGSSVLAQSLTQNNGLWRAAAIPNWEAGTAVNAAMGGSGTAVSSTSPNKAAAVAFAQWYGTDWPLANVGKAGGATFPASLTVQKDPAYLNAPSEILGGQLAAQLYVQLSGDVAEGWQFLPYQLYANNLYKDTAGQQVASGFDLAAGLSQWQEQIVSYGRQQGFTVNGS
ncbi:ABC transporter substrate-binding protein [Nakamurella deserti]|uniref:ABC transporter substrate-binding protein n=1 Tax=Nakamurella deserti TaxID=2164074 RepID=UPI000DBE1036|nr:sugar ABC transporter substrate-binding protein [Nakamurella deserti]